MLDPAAGALALSAGGCGSLVALALLAPPRRRSPREWLARRSRPESDGAAGDLLRRLRASTVYAAFRRGIALRLEQAGRREVPELAVGIALLASVASGAAVAIVALIAGAPVQAPLTGAAAGAAVLGLLSRSLSAAAAERRRRLLGQLGPIL